MHKENANETQQQANVSRPSETTDQGEGPGTQAASPGEEFGGIPLDQLSDVWRELLGKHGHETLRAASPNDAPIPTLETDPWSALLQANGVEVVDLQRINLQISDQEVEQLLEVLPDEEKRACKETGSNN